MKLSYLKLGCKDRYIRLSFQNYNNLQMIKHLPSKQIKIFHGFVYISLNMCLLFSFSHIGHNLDKVVFTFLFIDMCHISRLHNIFIITDKNIEEICGVT